MSVYCSFGDFDDEEDSFPQPYIYHRSHVIPRGDHPRGGFLDFGSIGAFLTRDGYDDAQLDDFWPFLRMSLQGGGDESDTIVLDAYQVDTLIEVLTTWRNRVSPELLAKELSA